MLNDFRRKEKFLPNAMLVSGLVKDLLDSLRSEYLFHDDLPLTLVYMDQLGGQAVCGLLFGQSIQRKPIFCVRDHDVFLHQPL